MKTLKIIFVILMVLIPFSVRAKDYKEPCCDVCVKWDRVAKPLKCLKYECISPCPYKNPAFGGHNDIILAGYVSTAKGFSVWNVQFVEGESLSQQTQGISGCVISVVKVAHTVRIIIIFSIRESNLWKLSSIA